MSAQRGKVIAVKMTNGEKSAVDTMSQLVLSSVEGFTDDQFTAFMCIVGKSTKDRAHRILKEREAECQRTK